jgi:hypothetical protein
VFATHLFDNLLHHMVAVLIGNQIPDELLGLRNYEHLERKAKLIDGLLHHSAPELVHAQLVDLPLHVFEDLVILFVVSELNHFLHDVVAKQVLTQPDELLLFVGGDLVSVQLANDLVVEVLPFLLGAVAALHPHLDEATADLFEAALNSLALHDPQGQRGVRELRRTLLVLRGLREILQDFEVDFHNLRGKAAVLQHLQLLCFYLRLNLVLVLTHHLLIVIKDVV